MASTSVDVTRLCLASTFASTTVHYPTTPFLFSDMSSNRWNNLRSSWTGATSSESGKKGGTSSKSAAAPLRNRRPSAPSSDLNSVNLAPHSIEESPSVRNRQRKIPLPSIFQSDTQQQPQRLSQQQPKIPWRQSIVSSWKNRSTGSHSSDGQASNRSLSSQTTSFETNSVQYEDLLTVPPRIISFVISNNIGNDSRNDTGNEKEEKKEIDAVDEEQDQAAASTEKGLETISTTQINCTIGELLGVDLAKNTTTKQFEITEHSLDEPTTENTPLLPPQLAILLLPGDILQSINGVPCRRFGDLEELRQKILEGRDVLTRTTLTFECRSVEQQGQNASQGAIHQVTYVTKMHLQIDLIKCAVATEESAAEGALPSPEDAVSPSPQTSPTATAFVEPLDLPAIHMDDPATKTPILHLDSIPIGSWLENTCANSSNVIVSVNSIPCYELDPDDANLAIQTMSQTHPYINIKLYSPPIDCRESIRRAAVATAGGAMMGTGAVMMATPLHPLGHAMAIGGLGVLGTEFEAPKKAFNKMKDAVTRRQSTTEEPSTNDA